MHFEKSEYDQLTNEQKQRIRSNFLFSGRTSTWISRCNFPNLYRPRKVAEEIGLEDAGKTGERRTFSETLDVKSRKAEYRADRMDYKSELAMKRGKQLQKRLPHRNSGR